MRLAQALLFHFILQGGDGQHGRCAIGNAQVIGRNGHAARAQALHFGDHMVQVHHAARAQQVHFIGMQNAGGNQIELEFALIGHDGVAGVVAALIADDGSKLRHKVVHHAALALVTPANTHDRAIVHCNFLLSENNKL